VVRLRTPVLTETTVNLIVAHWENEMATSDPPALGQLVLYTITDAPVFTHSALEKLVRRLALDPAHLPLPTKYVNAFKRATSDVENLTYPLAGNRTARTVCRQVSTGRDRIVVQVSREVGSPRRLVEYSELITAKFFRPSTPEDQTTARLLITLNPDHLEPGELPHVQRIARQIKERYDQHFDYLDGAKVRKMVRAYLYALNAIEIKGGVYFVHANRAADLAKLTELVNGLGGGCTMDLIEIADNQRDFIARAFEAEAMQALEGLRRDVRAIPYITPAACDKMFRRYDEVMNSVADHRRLLDIRDPQSAITSAAESTRCALEEMTPGKEVRK
jgi:hypothetical protein